MIRMAQSQNAEELAVIFGTDTAAGGIEREACTDHTDELISHRQGHKPRWMGCDIWPWDFSDQFLLPLMEISSAASNWRGLAGSPRTAVGAQTL